jgi:hypothetical protein
MWMQNMFWGKQDTNKFSFGANILLENYGFGLFEVFIKKLTNHYLKYAHPQTL